MDKDARFDADQARAVLVGILNQPKSSDAAKLKATEVVMKAAGIEDAKKVVIPEGLFGRTDPIGAGDRHGQTVEQCRLAGPCAGQHDVAAPQAPRLPGTSPPTHTCSQDGPIR